MSIKECKFNLIANGKPVIGAQIFMIEYMPTPTGLMWVFSSYPMFINMGFYSFEKLDSS